MKFFVAILGSAMTYLLIGESLNVAQSLFVQCLGGWVAIDIYETFAKAWKSERGGRCQ